MTTPPRKRSSLGQHHPASPEAAHNKASAPQAQVNRTGGAKARMTIYLPDELAGQVRAVIANVPPAASGHRNVSDLITAAVDAEVRRLQAQHNNGQPWPHTAPAATSPGRPPAT